MLTQGQRCRLLLSQWHVFVLSSLNRFLAKDPFKFLPMISHWNRVKNRRLSSCFRSFLDIKHIWISQRHIPEQKPGSRTEPFSIHLECNCYLTPNIKRAACREGETSWPLSYFLTRTEGPSSYIDIPLENKRSAARSSFRELMQRRRGRERERERHKSTKQLQLCTCITLFCTFLCCCFTTTTWNHLVSRFMEGSELKTTIFVFFFWI